MIIDCIGCLHGARPKLKGGDLLIITGDLTANDTLAQINQFKDWFVEVANPLYKKTVMIAGNHDNWIKRREFFNQDKDSWEHPHHSYLEDSGTTFEGLKIWGSPWSSRFKGINPKCCAFTGKNDEEIAPKFDLIPSDVDILITHSPPFTIRDLLTDGRQVGSSSLMGHHISRLRPKLWAFSHIHEGYGLDGPYQWAGCRYVNCSIMNERYEPINAPIRIELSDKDFPSRG